MQEQHIEASYTELIRELGSSAKDLVQNEFRLIKAEVNESTRLVQTHLTQLAICGVLLALSVIPFMAFAVIGLGVLMGGMYWLSALIVAVAFAAPGAFFAYRAYTKLTSTDLTLPHSRHALNHLRRDQYGFAELH